MMNKNIQCEVCFVSKFYKVAIIFPCIDLSLLMLCLQMLWQPKFPGHQQP